ncbi:hypothetical protein CN671_24835 [Bacillus toyonensis]|nr:hypothetical protein CN671_24835 [Bacillus toyonensis]
MCTFDTILREEVINLKKAFSLRLPEELHKGASVKASNDGLSLQSYIQSLIEKDLNITVAPRVIPLIDKIRHACKTKKLKDRFTTKDIQDWIRKNKIINDQSGEEYSNASVQSLLSNSSYDNKDKNKNLNKKVLNRKLNSENVYEYWF